MNLNEILSIIIGIFVLLGALLSLLSAYGVIRFPDVYTRSHAATKSSTLGIMFILTSAFLYFAIIQGYANARLLLGIIFVFITAPVAGHLICRAAYRTQVPLWERTVQDDLKLALKEEDYQKNAEQ